MVMAETVLAAAVVETPPLAPAAPVGAPAATPAPVTTPALISPPVTPVPVTPEMQQYITVLEQRDAASQEREDLALLQDHVVRYAARLVAEQGFTEEQAKYVAEHEGQQAFRERQALLTREGQISTAFDIAARYKINPRRLMNLSSREAMVATAKDATEQGQMAAELTALRNKVASLEKAQPQAFASGTAAFNSTSGPVTPARLAAMNQAEYMEWRKTGLK